MERGGRQGGARSHLAYKGHGWVWQPCGRGPKSCLGGQFVKGEDSLNTVRPQLGHQTDRAQGGPPQPEPRGQGTPSCLPQFSHRDAGNGVDPEPRTRCPSRTPSNRTPKLLTGRQQSAPGLQEHVQRRGRPPGHPGKLRHSSTLLPTAQVSESLPCDSHSCFI